MFDTEEEETPVQEKGIAINKESNFRSSLRLYVLTRF